MLAFSSSDASSEYLSTVDLTDSEDAGRNGLIIGQGPTGPQVAVMGGSYAGLSPMIIMNNFVLKMVSLIAVVNLFYCVVLLQPMVANGSSNTPKMCPENIQQSKSYMPILKSYPRIAPQPVEVPAKRMGSSRVSSRARYDQRKRRHQHSHGLYSSPSPQLTPETPVKVISSFEAETNQAQAAKSQELPIDRSPSPLAGTSFLFPLDEFSMEVDSNKTHSVKYQDVLSADSNKLKRFSNTYNILNKSGLLGITLRTKQLIRENKRTQGQLQRLQEQTALLLEALSSGDPQLWTKLQLSLQYCYTFTHAGLKLLTLCLHCGVNY
uniref:Uncharacterized protein n=1 Tax=Monopterus albus TaxID=43700 RepID=A0A3Q3ITY1_MONAL